MLETGPTLALRKLLKQNCRAAFWSLHLHLRAGDSLLPTLEQATFGGRDIMMKAQHSLG
jgi:hypothetical protein